MKTLPFAREHPVRLWLAGGFLLVLAACSATAKSPSGPVPEKERPQVEVPPERADTQKPIPNPPPILRQPAAPPALAKLRGWMPLGATGVPGFLAAHPEWDGRGVLIAILDSGIDPAVPGLGSTSSGRPKVLDVRDFSGEGRIPLTVFSPPGDTASLLGHRFRGFGRIRGLTVPGPWYSGLVRERALGEPPAADLNDNGRDSDSLVVIVAKAIDGWVLFADTDGDGSFENERPVHDYLLGREIFGWHRRSAAPPVSIAANLSDGPELDLVYDTDAHGTHVAGIAAAHDIGGVGGFDGVAPGAQLLGLKISRNDFGGLTTTGSVLASLDYAIRFAAGRNLPLVVNMSFGVGNEREGSARLDALLDSVLLAHPEVVFVTSVGNDGPGLSTVGFPGSLRRGITVGATEPSVFLPPSVGSLHPGADPLLFFSSRGGEIAKPDLVAPGIAYSTVPPWNMGEEFKTGTSMASPHIAGLVALLLSAAQAQHREVRAEDLRRALAGSARPVAGQSFLDAGAGVPQLETAWELLQQPAPPAEFDVENADQPGSSAAFRIGVTDTLVRFRIVPTRGSGPLEFALLSDTRWLTSPASLRWEGGTQTVTLVQHPPATPGTYTGSVAATTPGVSGPLFRLLSTLVIPDQPTAAALRVTASLRPGEERRAFFVADSGRPFRVRLATAARDDHLIAALHQPGGAPILGDNGIPGGADTAAAVFEVDARDARSGFYQAVAVAPAGRPITARIAIDHSPVALAMEHRGDSLVATLRGLADTAVAGRLRPGALGAERRVAVSGTGGRDVLVPFELPSWASRLVVDLELAPEQWPHFTDFGLTALDGSGRILGKNPANYARTRLSVDLPARATGDTATIALAPGFADPGSREPWSGQLTIRLQAARAIALEAREGEEFHLAGRQPTAFHIRVGEPPWALPPQFGLLVGFLLESAGLSWSWELPLDGASGSRP